MSGMGVRGRRWHLVSGGQGCCESPIMGGLAPAAENDLEPLSVEAEKPWSLIM